MSNDTENFKKHANLVVWAEIIPLIRDACEKAEQAKDRIIKKADNGITKNTGAFRGVASLCREAEVRLRELVGDF